jgi:predicted NodU family carbamoyl transferase
MIKAIVYTSNTGSTADYARLFSEKTGLPFFSIDQAKNKLRKGSEIIYFGWIMASEIKGYKEASNEYKICAACAVGMGETGMQVKEVRSKTKIPEKVPVFTLQGSFDIHKLSGMYKLMMSIMVKTAGKSLEKKANRTKEEDVMLDMMQHGGNHVCIDNMKELLDWYEGKEN